MAENNNLTLDKLKNFEFKCYGQNWWYSRSMTGVLFPFAYSKDKKEWCVLIGQRGPGTPTEHGKWCCACGYTDHFESVFNKECYKNDNNEVENFRDLNHGNYGTAWRECLEETGVDVPVDSIKFLHLDTYPHGGRQNYNCLFYAILPGDVNDYALSTKYNEPDEVSELKWCPMSEVDKYEFAFNHKNIIHMIYDKYVGVSWFRKKMIKLSGYLNEKYGFGNPIS